MVEAERWGFFRAKGDGSQAELGRFRRTRLKPPQIPPQWTARVLEVALSRDLTAFELLCRPEVRYRDVLELIGEPDSAAILTSLDDRLGPQIALQLEVAAKYSGYIERQHDEIERQRRHEELTLPLDLAYTLVAGLSIEVRQRLTEVRPLTLGQAARTPGVTPAAISVLLVHLKKHDRAA